MTDPSGLRVIEALCPAVSRYAMACPPYPMAKPIDYAPSMGTATIASVSEDCVMPTVLEGKALSAALRRAIAEMRTYEPAEYCDLDGWHRS